MFVHLGCFDIVYTKLFDNISIVVILVNSIVMIFDTTNVDPENTSPFFAKAELAFLILYTIECVLKIVGYGFILGSNAYLKDPWNLLDFFIVVSSYPSLFNTQEVQGNDGSFSPGSLRVFRVLRPLKSITKIKGLRVLMTALFAAIPLLIDTMMILAFFFMLFSIAGVQLMTGELKKRCFSIQTGKLHEDDILCGGLTECPGGFFCGKSNMNPNYGVTNFDNLPYAFLTVF